MSKVIEAKLRDRIDELERMLLDQNVALNEQLAAEVQRHETTRLSEHMYQTKAVNLEARVEAAERERDTASRLQQEQAQANLAAIEHHMARAETAEAKLAELVAWRREQTQVEVIRGHTFVRHHHARLLRMSYHEQGEKCDFVYLDGTTECAWLAAHKAPEQLKTETTVPETSG